MSRESSPAGSPALQTLGVPAGPIALRARGWRPRAALALLVSLAALAAARVSPVWAVMDIANNGPVLDAGRFSMRITNIGVIGNAFFNKGLSYDPSFEFPKGSGHECLEHAELWVGATHQDGTTSVSGGPVFEFRPTLDSADVVAVRFAGDRGTRATVDDDGDGQIDEEFLDGRDDDGDGEVDEDLRFPAQQSAATTFADDHKESVEFAYENGERHVPMHLTVKQEAHAWSLPGFDKLAAIHYTVTNHGSEQLRDVRLGVYANLDSRERTGGSGHLDDVVTMVGDSVTINDGVSVLASVFIKPCFTTLKGEWAAVHDARLSSQAPWTALVGVSHTTDPLGYLNNFAFTGQREASARARAPRKDTTFTTMVFSPSLPPRQGGPPTLDADRMAALRGEFANAPLDEARDYSVLVSCGPFPRLDPGQSLEFAVAFIAGENRDSLVAAAQSARLAWRGSRLNLMPDRTGPTSFQEGRTGINGHEICYQPPPGVEFTNDPHCTNKFYVDPAYIPPPTLPPGGTSESAYSSNLPCIWTDMDCDACTGLDGRETVVPWFVQAPAPPQPKFRSVPGDRAVKVEWDNLPEILAAANVMPGAPWTFWGYRLYRLDQWDRESLLPPAVRWQQLASFAVDTTLGARPLGDVLDSTVVADSIAYERPHYPVGRYRFTDLRVQNGFDYHYVVTAVAQRQITITGTTRTELIESPFRAVFSGIVRPRTEAGVSYRDGKVWVVPNPFRQNAPWDRAPVPGDAFTRHVDFMGLPRSVAKIRIYTLAGDLVQTLTHDGTNGDGQHAWDLISRNGQDIESGVYLFTVEWAGNHQVGRFVIIR